MMALGYPPQNNVEFHAISFDYGMKELIENFQDNSHLYVHSVFKRVINFKDEKDRLYSIALKDVCNGPRTLRVDNSIVLDLKDIGICIGERVLFYDSKVKAGSKLTIDFDGAGLWIPQDISITNGVRGNFIKNSEVYNYCLLSNGADGGAKNFYIDKFIGIPHSVKATLVEKELGSRIELLLGSIILKENNFQRRVNSLIGFGNGLTPSGDDFLTGLIVFLYYTEIEIKNYLLKEIKNILYSQKPSTTDVSRNMLYASLEGMAAEYVLDFIEALLFKERDEFIRAVKNLFTIGSSSGTDISAGIMTSARLCFDILEMEGEKWYQKQ